MTHIVHPYAHRLGVLRDWRARWFARDSKKYREFLRADTVIREFLEKRLRTMHVGSVEIERNRGIMRIVITTSRPGLIIGRSGEGTAKLRKEIAEVVKSLHLVEQFDIKLDIEEIRSPESNAAIVAQMVVEGLEKRLPFRRVLKQTIEKVMANRDVKGVRITVSGRLGGADMSRSEDLKKGQIPLQTLRADIDFKRASAHMSYGTIGVKVWIYKGDVFGDARTTGGDTRVK